jgi:hypothetical protein
MPAIMTVLEKQIMNEEKILNKGLQFALEFGTNWLQPIQSRLSNTFPHLETNDLNNYDRICRTAMKTGHNYIYKKLESAAFENRKLNEKDLARDLKSFLHKDYPWIDDSNLKTIFSQGCYYAWKDGLDKSIWS